MLKGFTNLNLDFEKLAMSGVDITTAFGNLISNSLALLKMVTQNAVTVLNGAAGKKACSTNGVSAITGGTGIADMTLAAPSVGDVATIRIDSLTSNTVVVTCAPGVTVDGTNSIMTFNAANDTIILAYKSATQWQVVANIGGVALSDTE